jgi:hypothetical protein
MALLGAVTDAAGATTALHVATALATAAFVVALPRPRSRRGVQAS